MPLFFQLFFFFETELLVTTHEQVLFAWIINHQPAVLLSQNEPATSNQPAVLFFQKKPAPAISHQPTEQAVGCTHAVFLIYFSWPWRTTAY
jgi:hypothetical protein